MKCCETVKIQLDDNNCLSIDGICIFIHYENEVGWDTTIYLSAHGGRNMIYGETKIHAFD